MMITETQDSRFAADFVALGCLATLAGMVIPTQKGEVAFTSC